MRPDVAVASDGSAAIAWLAGSPFERALQSVNRVAPTQPFGVPEEHANGLATNLPPAVAVAEGGMGSVVWAGNCPAEGQIKPASAMIADGGEGFGPPLEIAGSECPTDSVGTVIDALGRATAMFSGRFPERSNVRLAHGSSDGFQPAASVTGNARASFGELAADAAGRLVLGWTVSEEAARNRVMVLVREPGGAEQRFQVNEDFGRGPMRLSLSDAGNGLVAWQERYRPNRILASPIRTLPAHAGRPLRVSGKLPHGALADFAVAAGPDGRSYVAWSRRGRNGVSRGLRVAWIERGVK